MRSTNKKNRSAKDRKKVFLLFGQTPVAALCTDLVYLFRLTGFDTVTSLAEPDCGWVSEKLVGYLSGAEPVGCDHADFEDFDLLIGIGLDASQLADVFFVAPANAIWRRAAASQTPAILLSQESVGLKKPALGVPPTVSSSSFPCVIAQFTTDPVPGSAAKAVNRVFSAAVEFLSARNKLGKLSFKTRFSPPAEFAHLASARPSWCNDLESHFLLAGFRPAVDGSDNSLSPGQTPAVPSVFVDTWQGPFPVKTIESTSFMVSLVPPPTALPDGCRLLLRFVSPQLDPVEIRDQISENSIFASVQETGAVTVHDQNGARVFPDLAEAPAMRRLVRYIADRQR